ncbi:MAG TPA: glycoside hydrolase family 38 C-terminal domain-containing protein [Solirubrobacteraceae bacterium]|nr:glycoside hydrolase family 38 C-terminal domain-containing protein [Solirubrobacteraceae bacterium]
MRFFVVPHTHWDREWYLPFEEFQLKLAAVVDELIDVLEADPSFASFTLDGQAIVLEDYLDARPEQEARLRALLAAGRLEVGPSYVLPDELLVGGESLVRNLLIGRAVCERFGTAPSPVGYLPDSFGHPLQLPQILAGFGIESFVFSRGMGDELDELGAAFRWRAPNGSEVLACQQFPNYGNFGHVTDAADAQARIEAIIGQFAAALERTGGREMLLCAGDDHLPVRRDLPALCAELQARLPASEFRIARYSDYVDAVRRPDLPAHAGELLGSRVQNILRGVNSARLYLKQANERAERRLLAAETLSALASLRSGEPFPVSDFRLAWRQLLRCQPHDSICGCSCDEVHRDMLVRYGLLDRQVDELERRALGGGAAGTLPASIGVANPLPERRRALVTAPGAEPVVVELDGFSTRTIDLAPAQPTRPPAESAAIESDCLRVEARPDGTLSVLDKPSGRRFEGLHRFEDELDMGDLYNFCPVPGAPVWRSKAAAVRVLRDGPVVWELELRIAGPLSIVTVVRLVDRIRRVEFHTAIDNRARDHRLRVVFPTGADANTGTVRAEGQFALVHRPLHPPEPRTEWIEPPDSTQHTLGAVALGPLALLTRGLPEYEARPDSEHGPELCLTLLRAVGLISRPSGAIATRPLGAGPDLPTPEGQCLGRHELEYALLPGADTLDATALLRASQDYRHPFILAPGGTQLDSPMSIDGDVVFSCLKGAEDGDGLILRCFNPSDERVQVRIDGELDVSRVRLDETDVTGQGTALGPREIVSFRLRA